MTAAAVCPECGSPVFVEDRFCGACGTPIATTVSTSHAAKLLGELRALTAGEYEIRGEIGRGGMAVVYLAYDLRLNRKVAIKAMLPDLAFHAGMEERFKREARTAARLDHPNIVVIYSVRDAGDPLFFVMKFVDGAPLDVIIRRHGPLPISVVQGVLLQICAALQYAHGEGVVHRDVKPANVLVDSRGHVQVTDFGIAKAVDSVQLTRTGMAIGTPTYMCPEQCAGRPQSPASDQYSVGVVGYELLTGRPPFLGSAVEMQWAHLKDEPPPITTWRADVPPTLAAAIMRMLSKDPKDRWPALRDAIPLIASGNPVDPDTSRIALAELVRTSPPTRPSLVVTPLSPVPQNAAPAAPAAPPAPAPAAPPRMEQRQAARAAVAEPPVASPLVPSTPPVAAPALATLELIPRQCSVEIGTTERIRCVVRDAQGREVNHTTEWSSSDPAIASVDDTGLVTAHEAGSVTIAAIVGTLASMVNVEVIPVTIGRVDVEPNVISVQEHGAIRLTIRAYTAKAKLASNLPATFRMADPAIAEFDAAGNVRGITPGRTTGVVSIGGFDARLIVTVTPSLTREAATVTPPPQKRGRSRAVLVTAGLLIAAAGAAWAVIRGPNVFGTVASVSSTGTVDSTPQPPARAAVAPPVATPTTSPVVAAPKAPVVVPNDTVVAALELADRSPMTAEVGETKMLVAKVTNKNGELLPTARVTWEASEPSIASVDRDGVLTAVATGRSLVTAKVGDRTRVIAVDVQSTVRHVTISIQRDSLQPGESASAVALVLDRRDAALQVPVTWRSTNPAVASVDDGGVVRASGTGRTIIIATAGAVADSVPVVVLTAAAASAPEPAAPAAKSAPNEAETQAIADSIVAMIERQTMRMTQLTRAAGEPGSQFQKFLETNSPTAKLAGAPTVTSTGAGSAKLAVGVVLGFEKGEARKERTVNLEYVVEAVRGGWAIREVRFPGGFTP